MTCEDKKAAYDAASAAFVASIAKRNDARDTKALADSAADAAGQAVSEAETEAQQAATDLTTAHSDWITCVVNS